MAYIPNFIREYGMQYWEVCMHMASKGITDFCNMSIYDCIIIPKNNQQAFCLEEKKMSQFIANLKEVFCKDKDSFDKMEELFHKTGKEYLDLTKKIADMDLSNLDNQELIRIYKEYQLLLLRYTTVLWMAYNSSVIVTDMAEEVIKKKTDDPDDYFQAVFIPKKKAMISKLKEEIIAGKDINDLYERYRWIPCIDIIFKPWTKEEFLEAISGLKEEKKTKYTFEEAIKKLDVNEKEKDILEMANIGAYIRDKKDEYRREGIYNILSLFDDIKRRIKLDPGLMLEQEVIDALNGKAPDKNIIKERKEGFVMYHDDKDVVCVTGKKKDEMIKKFGVEEKDEEKDEVKGIPAHKGIVKGIARIVTSKKDMGKVKKGDILIAVSTHPDYITAMENSAGFVTDEGGLTCHAAIVAREIGKPCIVGTKEATRTFKDGDVVEVDADNGVVRIIKENA